MLKILGCIMIFAGSTCIGLLKSASYKARRTELENTIELLRMLQMNITYRKDSLQKTFVKTAELKECWFSDLLINCSDLLAQHMTIAEAWRISIEKNMAMYPLYHDDLEVLKDVAMGLGKSDTTGQSNVFEPALLRLASALREAAEQEKKQGRMYRSLGISAGLVIVILFL
ncbi:MAG: hypothetical protein ACI4LD_04215 [Lentihominibacter sp.]